MKMLVVSVLVVCFVAMATSQLQEEVFPKKVGFPFQAYVDSEYVVLLLVIDDSSN